MILSHLLALLIVAGFWGLLILSAKALEWFVVWVLDKQQRKKKVWYA